MRCGSPTTTTRGTTSRATAPFVWSVIGALSQATDLPVTTGVTCPTVRIHPAIIAQAAATSARAARRPLHARRRQRRGAQRAHPRRPLARGRRAPGDARGGRRGHPHAVAGRPVQPPRAPLHGRERAHLRPARRAAAASSSPASAPRRSGSRRASATASARPRPTRRRSTSIAPRAARGPVQAGTKVCFGRRGRRRAPPRTACGPTRRCRASWRRCCRPRRTSSRRASSSSPRCSSRLSAPTSSARGVAARVRRRGRRRALRPADRPRAGCFLRRVGARGPSALRLTLARNPRFDRRAIR